MNNDRGNFHEGQPVEFDGGKKGKKRGVTVEFAGKRWVIRTTDGHIWRVPARLLTPGKVKDAEALRKAGEAQMADRRDQREAAVDLAHVRLANVAEAFKPGERVEVIHKGTWGWEAEVIAIVGGKVKLTNPTRILLLKAKVAGIDHGRKASDTITVWANRVRKAPRR